MKKKELENLLQQINEKIESAESLKQKIDEASQLLTSVKTQSVELGQSVDTIKQFKEQVGQAKGEVDPLKESIVQASVEAKNYQTIIVKQKEEYSKLKKDFEEINTESEGLNQSIRDQLGLVSMETLANSFFDEAKKLKESARSWFWWLFGSVLVLLAVTTAIAIWQIAREGTLFELNFLIKLPLVTPVVYFVVFTAQQYSRDRKLFDEYTFKSSVARSFEAYRKILGEESESETQLVKDEARKDVMNFIITTIKSIYSSPMENINHNSKKDDEVPGIMGLLKKIYDLVKKSE